MHDDPTRGNFLSEKGDATIVLMTALMMLLMALFAVLNALSVKDEKKERAALGSVTESLGVLPGGIRPEVGKDYQLASPPILDVGDDLASKGISVEALYDLILSSPGKKWYQIITLKKSNEGLNISLSDQSFFASGTADLVPEKLAVLDKIGALIQKSSCDVLIKGHTDDTPMSSGTSGRYSSNWELSAARAMNILKHFVRQGISLVRLEAAGYGEYDPLFPNDTPEHRAFNRRVEIQLVQRRKEEIFSKDSNKDINVQGFLFKMRNLRRE
ncbi:MAG: flagellar motor protein MotB [bacterium]